MSRNFGLGSRDMSTATRRALHSAVMRKEISYATAATVGNRFDQFLKFAKALGIRRLEHITPDHVTHFD